MVLHRHDCSACRYVLPRYQDLATAGQNVALIELPPYGEFGPKTLACRYGRLRDDREWFVQTPVELQLSDGIITAARYHGD